MNVRSTLLASLFAAFALPAVAVAQAQGEDQTVAQCAAGEINGISADNAATAVQLVCSAITSRVSPANGSSYRVDMGRLGRLAILTVRTIRAGEPDKAMSVQLEGIEEVAVAAPRLGEAVATGKPFESTAGVDNLVREENRKYAGKKRDGESLYGGGLYGMTLLNGEGEGNGAGLIGKYEYQMPGFGAGVSGFFNFEHPFMAGFSVDGRKFFSESDFAPFAGGGLAYVGFSDNTLEFKEGETYVSNASLGAYVSGGFEAFRSYQNRLTIEARAFLPFSAADKCTEGELFDSKDCGDTAYAVPVMINLTFLVPN
jgi:hypothetical protein